MRTTRSSLLIVAVLGVFWIFQILLEWIEDLVLCLWRIYRPLPEEEEEPDPRSTVSEHRNPTANDPFFDRTESRKQHQLLRAAQEIDE